MRNPGLTGVARARSPGLRRRCVVKTHGVTRYGDQPEVRLRGAWLSRLGFDIGARVVVEATPGRLVLREPTEDEWANLEVQAAERDARDAERTARVKRAMAVAAKSRFRCDPVKIATPA